MAVVESSLHFLTRDNVYEHEKPYQLRYKAAKEIPATNIRLEKQESIKISSIRGQERQLSFEKNGFTVLKMDQEVPYDDFSTPAGVTRYLNMVAEQLKKRLGAEQVQVYQYVVSTWKLLHANNQNAILTTSRFENVIQVFPLQKKAKSTNSLSHLQSLISVSSLFAATSTGQAGYEKLTQIQDTTPEHAVAISKEVNGDAAKEVSPNLRFQVVK